MAITVLAVDAIVMALAVSRVEQAVHRPGDDEAKSSLEFATSAAVGYYMDSDTFEGFGADVGSVDSSRQLVTSSFSSGGPAVVSYGVDSASSMTFAALSPGNGCWFIRVVMPAMPVLPSPGNGLSTAVPGRPQVRFGHTEGTRCAADAPPAAWSASPF